MQQLVLEVLRQTQELVGQQLVLAVLRQTQGLVGLRQTQGLAELQLVLVTLRQTQGLVGLLLLLGIHPRQALEQFPLHWQNDHLRLRNNQANLVLT